MNVFMILRNSIAALLASILVALAGIGSVVGFTDGNPITAQKQSYCFDNDRLIIGGYNCIEAGNNATQIEYMQDAGFDMIITGRKMSEEFLSLCDASGLGVIPTNQFGNASYGYWDFTDEQVNKWLNITEENYDYSHPCIWGDNLIDEPTAAVFKKVETASAHYYANTTGKFPLTNLFPMYANSEQLGTKTTLPFSIQEIDFLNERVDEYKRHVSEYINTISTDYICVDIYPLNVRIVDGVAKKTTYGGWLRNLDILAEACRATNRDLWVITQSSGISKTEDGPRFCDTAEDIRWQAYASLAFGTKAIIHACYYGGWWSSDSHMINENGERTDTYYAVQTVNNELACFADIYGNYINKGAYLVNGARAAGNQSNFLTPVDSKYKPNIVGSSPLLVGCFEGETEANGSAYVFTNMNEPENGKSAQSTIKFSNAKEITVYRKGQAEIIEGNTLKLSLDSCEGVFVTVK